MRISHKYKFVFLSKPRCGSESIRKALNPYSDIFSKGNHPYHHHTPALQLKLHFDKMGWSWSEYFKFISIRNPWELVVSFYHYAKPDINGIYFWEKERFGEKRDKNKLISFDGWPLLRPDLKKSFSFLYFKDGEYFRNKWTNDLLFLTLGYFILDENGHSLVDEIVRLEDIDHCMKSLFNGLKLPYKRIKKTNRSVHGHYRSYYTEETRKLVEEQFTYDIEMGNYRF